MHVEVLYAYVCTAEYEELISCLVPAEIRLAFLSHYTSMLLMFVLNSVQLLDRFYQ